MPRMGRTILPDYPHHVVQRGHNRQVVFSERADYLRYLETLSEFKGIYGVKIYAYCLMTNHVHLLVAPEDLAGLGALMKRLAGGSRGLTTIGCWNPWGISLPQKLRQTTMGNTTVRPPLRHDLNQPASAIPGAVHPMPRSQVRVRDVPSTVALMGQMTQAYKMGATLDLPGEAV